MRKIILVLVLFLVGCTSSPRLMPVKPPPVYKVGDKVRLKGYSQVMVVSSDTGYSVNVTWLDNINQPHSFWYRHDLLERQE